jgi:hypothetical protein
MPGRTISSTPFRAMLLKRGEITPPWGIPLVGLVTTPFSTIPAFIHWCMNEHPDRQRILLVSSSINLCEILSKHFSISTAKTCLDELGLFKTARNLVIAS